MNDPSAERAKADEMTAAAQDSRLTLSEEELRVAMDDMNVFSEKHPYPRRLIEGGEEDIYSTDKGEVNVFNCKKIFNEYCNINLGESLNPKDQLYSYKRVGDRTVLNQVRYPTPSGWNYVTLDEFNSFWRDTDMDGIFLSARTKKKTSSQKEEMAFVYIAVVKLRQGGLLGQHNKPKPDVVMKSAARMNCVLGPRTPHGLNIKDKIFQSHNMSQV